MPPPARASDSADDGKPDPQGRVLADVVVEQAFAVAAKQLEVQEAAGAAEQGRAQGEGKIELGAGVAARALAQAGAQYPALLVAVADRPVGIAPVAGDVRVFVLVQIAVELGGEDQAAAIGVVLAPDRLRKQGVDAAGGVAVLAVGFVLVAPRQ